MSRSFALEWDSDYGIDHRRGWTVVIGGKVASQLEPWLAVALWKAWKSWRIWE